MSLSSKGHTTLLSQATSSEVVGNEIMLYDVVTRVSKYLDQLCSGLQLLNVLSVMRAFPGRFLCTRGA